MRVHGIRQPTGTLTETLDSIETILVATATPAPNQVSNQSLFTPTPVLAPHETTTPQGVISTGQTNGLIITTPVPPVTPVTQSSLSESPLSESPLSEISAAESGVWAGELPSFAASAPTRLDGRYVVQEGDTLWSVSIEMGLDLGETICAVAPDFLPTEPLVVGDVLEAPALGVRCHQVQEVETPVQIAEQYGVDVQAIVEESWNRIAWEAVGEPLPTGSHVRVPSGGASAALGDGAVADVEADSFLTFMLEQPVSVSPYMAYSVGGPRAGPREEPVPASWPYGSGQFTWPVYGWLSQGYRNDHRAIDIAAQTGTFVTAADRGVVIRAGWNNQGYGQFVVIDHNIDYITLYAHLDQVLVKEGEVVGQGQIIGTVGSTGNSTGPHLHFEIRDFGRRINPIELLAR